jgi:hypothetical protein
MNFYSAKFEHVVTCSDRSQSFVIFNEQSENNSVDIYGL